jgi:TonB family protein
MSRLPALCLSACLFATSAFAQTGPTLPRYVMSKPPPQFDGHVTESSLRSVIELQVDATGRVTEVRVLKGSGSEDYDKRVQSYYRKWRLMPALDENGVPKASKLRMGHSMRGMGPPEDARTTLKRTNPGEFPDEAPAEPIDPRVYDEGGRVLRMRCKDFLWEYDFLRDVAGGNAPFELELMTQTSLFEAAKKVRVPVAEYPRIKKNLRRTLRETAKTCRARPEDMYIEHVLAPALEAQLKT